MKNKNFFRNLSTTALAICSLSSAVAFSSYACLLSEDKNFSGYSWLFEEEDNNTSSEDGLSCKYIYFADLPVYNKFSDKYNPVEKWFINEVQLEPNDPSGSSFSVKSCSENDGGTVIIPKNIGEYEISEIAPDAKFPSNTKVLCVREGVNFDEDQIKKKNTQISIVVNNYDPVTYDPAQGLY